MSDRDDASSRPDDGSGPDVDDETAEASDVGRAGNDESTGGETAGEEMDVESALADEPLGEPRRIDDRVRYQWVVGSTVGAVVSAVVVTGSLQVVTRWVGPDLTGDLPLGISETTVLVAVLAFVAFEGFAGVRAVLLYRSWRYEIRADSLYLTRGVLTRVQTVAPYVRVQHIDTRRSPVERLLGLSSLVVYTAGSRGADVTIPGLTDERAAELQRRLKRLAIASEEEDAV